MLIHQSAIDWLTLTTFDRDVYGAWSALLGSANGTLREGRLLMYLGAWSGSLFVGEGAQQGRPHYMLRVSGEDADHLAPQLAFNPAHCSRIDLQITIELPPGYSGRDFADHLREERRDRRRRITLIESGEGESTVYIGHRSSERYYRIYVKFDAQGNPYLRFEVEFKGDVAPAVWRHIQFGQSLSAILTSEIEHLGFDGVGVLRRFHAWLGGALHISPHTVPTSESATLRWLFNAVIPVLRRLLNSHSDGPRLRQILEELLRGSD
jgi:hypothetical protein